MGGGGGSLGRLCTERVLCTQRIRRPDNIHGWGIGGCWRFRPLRRSGGLLCDGSQRIDHIKGEGNIFRRKGRVRWRIGGSIRQSRFGRGYGGR